MGMGPGWQNASATRGEVAQMLSTLLSLLGDRPKVVITSDVSVVLDKKDATYKFTAEVRDASGNVLDSPISWESSNPTELSISSSGLVTAREALGSTTITASSPGAEPAYGSAVVATLAPDTVLVQSSDVVSAGSSAVLSLNDRTSGSIVAGDIVMSGSGGTSSARSSR